MHSLQNSPKTLLKTPSTPQNRQTSETFRLLTDPQKKAHLDLAAPASSSSTKTLTPTPPPPSTHSQGSSPVAAAAEVAAASTLTVKRCPTPN